MTLMDRRTFLHLTGSAAALGAAGPGWSKNPWPASKTFTSDANGTFVDSVVVIGEESAVLIDAQIDRGNATALADMIAATGRRLETVLITHQHPDHFLGLGILMERFPDARPVAHPVIQSVLAQAGPPMFELLKGRMGPALADRVVIPEPLEGETIVLEGERISVLDPMHGDTAAISPVYIEALDTLITSDIAFADTHAYVAENTTPEALAMWRASLDALEDMGAGTVIPGHRLESSAQDASVFAHTRTYLDAWEAALGEAGTAEDLREGLIARVGDLPVPFFVDRAVGAAFEES